MPYFKYGKKEIEALAAKDAKLAIAMEKIGKIRRGVTPDLFSALVRSIIGQQISSKAADTVGERLDKLIGDITPEAVAARTPEEIQSCGMTMKKAEYIRSAAQRILEGDFDIEALKNMDDDGICKCLSGLKGVGKWTAEMLMIFSLQRPDVLSYDDLAIQRGLRVLYHHRKITKELFAKYRRRYSPYASVASLYLWEIASGKYGL